MTMLLYCNQVTADEHGVGHSIRTHLSPGNGVGTAQHPEQKNLTIWGPYEVPYISIDLCSDAFYQL